MEIPIKAMLQIKIKKKIKIKIGLERLYII